MKLIFQLILFLLPLGLFSQTEARFKMYPDPIHDLVIMENADCVKEVSILTRDGKVWIQTQHQSEKNIRLSTFDLPSNHYIIRVVKVDGSIQTQTFFRS